MSEASDEGPLNVMHIHEPRATQPAGPSDPGWLTRLSSTKRIVLDDCPDVYRGLARLCRVDRRAYGAVIVCVDQLTPVELEFFDVVARVCRDVNVYVYGWRRSQSRIRQAVDLGARGEVNEGVIDEWIAGLGVVDVEPDSASSLSAESAVDPGHAQPVISTGDDDEEPKDVAMGDDSTASPARVPWLKYDGGPSRAAPSRTAPSELRVSGRVAGSPRVQRPASYEPLLTDEELRALIGDDLPSLGPEWAHDRPGDDPSCGGS